jgi:hypothetical protein
VGKGINKKSDDTKANNPCDIQNASVDQQQNHW